MLESGPFRTTLDPPELPSLHNRVAEECDGPHQPPRNLREQRIDAFDRTRRGRRFSRSNRRPLRADPSAHEQARPTLSERFEEKLPTHHKTSIGGRYGQNEITLRLHCSDDERVFYSRQRRQHAPGRDVLKGGNNLGRTWMCVIVYPIVAVPTRTLPLLLSISTSLYASGPAPVMQNQPQISASSPTASSAGRQQTLILPAK